MKEFLLNSQLINLLLFPFLFIKEETDAIWAHKHIVRSIFRVVLTSIGCIIGAIGFFKNLLLAPFLDHIVEAFNVPNNCHWIASLYVAVLIGGGVIGTCARLMTKGFCCLVFGDADFYLTRKREHELEELFKLQGYNVSGDTIRRVINFCIRNLRNPLLQDFGFHPYDWKRILDAIIYEGDLEVFLEQQELLQKKLQKTVQRYNALTKYGDKVTLDKAIHLPFKNRTRFNYEEEGDPLLERQLSDDKVLVTSLSCNSLTALPREVRDQLMVLKVLAKFKHRHKHHDELLDQALNHLKAQEQHLSNSVFPLQFSPTSTESTTPNSNQSETSYEVEPINYSSFSLPPALRPKLTS